MKKYEMLYVLDPQDEVSKETVGWIKEQYEGIKARLLKEEEMGKRKLAFEIKSKTDGFYYLTQIEVDDPSTLQDFEHEAKLNQNILRYMKLNIG